MELVSMEILNKLMANIFLLLKFDSRNELLL